MTLYEATVRYANGETGILVCEHSDGSDVMRCQHNCDRSGICPHKTDAGNGCDLEGVTVLDVQPYRRIKADKINIDGAYNLMTASFREMLRAYKNGDDEYKELIMHTIETNQLYCISTGMDVETLQYMIKKQAAKEEA